MIRHFCVECLKHIAEKDWEAHTHTQKELDRSMIPDRFKVNPVVSVRDLEGFLVEHVKEYRAALSFLVARVIELDKLNVECNERLDALEAAMCDEDFELTEDEEALIERIITFHADEFGHALGDDEDEFEEFSHKSLKWKREEPEA